MVNTGQHLERDGHLLRMLRESSAKLIPLGMLERAMLVD